MAANTFWQPYLFDSVLLIGMTVENSRKLSFSPSNLWSGNQSRLLSEEKLPTTPLHYQIIIFHSSSPIPGSYFSGFLFLVFAVFNNVFPVF
jgi:hypothetical protein